MYSSDSVCDRHFAVTHIVCPFGVSLSHYCVCDSEQSFCFGHIVGNAGVNLDTPVLNGDIKRQSKLNDINVFNAKIRYNVTNSVAIYAAADNFTDQRYEMLMITNGQAFIYEMPGAAYTAGVKIKIE